ncbi:MAG: O-antigen ligase family protein [Dehalococcoidia bacterium]|nr:O-antigen ligase family protein [Dehalococcoidia bacterium]
MDSNRQGAFIRLGLGILMAATLLGVYSRLPLFSLALQAAVFGLGAVYLLMGGAPWTGSKWPIRAGLALGALLGASAILSLDKSASLISLGQWLSYGLLGYLAASAFRPVHMRFFSQYLLLLGVLMAVLAVYFYWGEVGNLALPVMNSIFGNKNHFGGYLLLLLPLALALYLGSASGREKLAYGTVAVFLGSTFMLTYSRGAWFASVPALALVAWAFRGRPRALVGWLAPIGAASVLVAFLISQSSLTQTLDLGYQGAIAVARAASGSEGQDTLAPRLDYWQGAIRIMASRPFSGSGLGTYEAVFPTYQRDPQFYSRFTHNFFLQIGAEAGALALIISLVLFGILGVAWVTQLLRTAEARTPPQGLLVGLAAGLIASSLHNLVELDWYIPAIGMLFALEAGIYLAISGKALPGYLPAQRPHAQFVGAVHEPPLQAGVSYPSSHQDAGADPKPTIPNVGADAGPINPSVWADPKPINPIVGADAGPTNPIAWSDPRPINPNVGADAEPTIPNVGADPKLINPNAGADAGPINPTVGADPKPIDPDVGADVSVRPGGEGGLPHFGPPPSPQTWLVSSLQHRWPWRRWSGLAVCVVFFFVVSGIWYEQLLLAQAEATQDPGQVETLLEAAAWLNPLDGDPYFRLADLQLTRFEQSGANGSLERGIMLAQGALARSPASDPYRILLSRLYLSGGRLEEAITQLEDLAGRLQPLQAPDAYRQLGQAYLRLGRFNEARALYMLLLAGFPRGADTPQPPQPGALSREEAAILLGEAHLALGNIYTSEKNTQKAREEYLASLDLKSDSAPASFNLGLIEFGEGRWTEALARFETASRLDPKHAPARYFHGLVLLNLGQREAAAADFRAALAVDPQYEAARRELGGSWKE